MQESTIRKLLPHADKMKKKGIKVYHINIGQPDIPTPKEFYEAIDRHREDVLSYGPSGGLEELRYTIVDYLKRYDIDIDVNDVWITTGGSEAVLFSMLATCDYGDEIIVPEPFYTNYNGFASIAGCKLIPLPTYAEDGFRPPKKKAFLSKITKKTKAILICSPNNPTGTIYTKDEMNYIAEIAREKDLFIISDEVYREFTFDGKRHTSVLSIEGIEDRVIMTDSISKRFSACGARVGLIVSRNRKLMRMVLKLCQARLCPPTLEQIGAIGAFKVFDKYIPDMIKAYQRRRDVVFDEAKKIEGAFCKKPEGAFYTIIKFPIADIEDFAKWMLTDFSVDKKTTMIAPGPGFYVSKGKGVDEARIAYVLEVDALKEAMEILRRGVVDYSKCRR